MTGREAVLARVRRANGGTSTDAAQVAREWEGIARGYRRTPTRTREETLDLLTDRLRDYDAHVVRVQPDGVAETVAAMLQERAKTRMVVPAGFDGVSLPEGFSFAIDDGLSAGSIDRFDGVLTESTVAIAETGTIVLQTVAGQGRRTVSLVPDYHLCLVRASDVVETVPEAMERLAARPAFAMTFISGPSATADIEMTRVKGVHGPRFLDVVLVMDEGMGGTGNA